MKKLFVFLFLLGMTSSLLASDLVGTMIQVQSKIEFGIKIHLYRNYCILGNAAMADENYKGVLKPGTELYIISSTFIPVSETTEILLAPRKLALNELPEQMMTTVPFIVYINCSPMEMKPTDAPKILMTAEQALEVFSPYLK